MSDTTNIPEEITKSGFTIYTSLQSHPDLFLPTNQLETVLNDKLKGLVLNQPIRTRSKVLKSAVCQALGYPVPKSFAKKQPRFPGQNFDTYVQKANNLQIWNEEVSASRRYVLVRVDASDIVTKVRVITGDLVATYDKTGTLTHKYQAKIITPATESKLVAANDTKPVVSKLLTPSPSPRSKLLAIRELFDELRKLEGKVIRNPGATQERNRGGALHEAIAKQLGQPVWTDNGQFPDIPDQLLEIKLQTSPTIDLGLVRPDSTEPIANIPAFRHCDVRYAVFYGTLVSAGVRLDHVVLTPGEQFFTTFRMFGGLTKNSKYQIPLPADFFDQAE